MKKLLIATAALMAIALTPLHVSATPLTVPGPNFLGSIDPGSPASPEDEEDYINQLLSMAAPSGPITVDGHTYVRSATPCVGCDPADADTGVKVNNPSDITGIDVTGWVYLLAKYGNISYVFLVEGLTSVDLPASLPGGNGNTNTISHYSLYNHTVPDGGATAGLLGLAMLGLGYLRRRMA